MKIIYNIDELKRYLNKIKKSNLILGYTPTMGAIHKGHISLLKKSKKQNNISIVSIFINSLQFNNQSDFANYPVSIENDIKSLERNGCDILFYPSNKEIYPDNFKALNFELGHLDEILEAKFRKNHFQGVCNVLKIFFELINPDNIYFGEKDYQQFLVVKKLLSLLNLNINLVLCKTIREEKGLAFSSRNTLLNKANISFANIIFKSLQNIQLKKDEGKNLQEAIESSKNFLKNNNVEIEYLYIMNEIDFVPCENWDESKNLRVFIAAYIQGVRLIDNLKII